MLSTDRLDSYLLDDAYKARMHECYASWMSGINLEFGLTVRHAPISLQDIATEDPPLWKAFQNALEKRLGCINLVSSEIVKTLRNHFHGFEVSPTVLQRAKLYGMPAVAWSRTNGDSLEAFAGGYPEGASHVETTLTQTVQELLILAQVRRCPIFGNGPKTCANEGEQEHALPSPDSLLGHALARLALGVQYLNDSLEDDVGVDLVLFAGRRSSSRRYLLLQNLYCQLNLKRFAGTSCIPVPLLLGQVAQEAPFETLLRSYSPPALVGTLAHEVPMALTQLLAEYDEVQIGNDILIVQICAILAHLLMLRANGGLERATALADTYGTPGFISTALSANLPPSFCEDMSLLYPDEWNSNALKHLHNKNAVVFDLFRVWRVDGGEYSMVASYIMDAWERRQMDFSSTHQGEHGQHPQRPKLMHSDLDSYEDIVRAAHLPPRIRPSTMCFGSLADGFLPFENIDDLGQTDDCIPKSSIVSMSSIVMKVVQATCRRRNEALKRSIMPCSGKLGDRGAETFNRSTVKTSWSKIQVDRRLCPSLQEKAISRMQSLESCYLTIPNPHDRPPGCASQQISMALSNAYDAVTRKNALNS